MASKINILAYIRRATAPIWAEGNDQPIVANERGEVCVVQALPPIAELVRLGNSYFVVGTGVAPVVALPTTAAHLSLWNGEPPGGKSYLIDAIGTAVTTTSAAAVNLGLGVQLNVTNPITNPTGAIAIKSLSGKANYGGKGNAKASLAVTNDSAWHQVGTELVCANASNLTLNVEYPVYGRYIVPPQGMFSLASLANAVSTLICTPIIFWHEVQLTLG
jgi:hypothetical protein